MRTIRDLQDNQTRRHLMNIAKSLLKFDAAFPRRGPSGRFCAFGGAAALDASRDTAFTQRRSILDGSLSRKGPVGGSSQRGPRFGGASGALRRLVASGALAIG